MIVAAFLSFVVDRRYHLCAMRSVLSMVGWVDGSRLAD